MIGFVGFFVSLLFGIAFGRYLIPFLRKLKFGQEVRGEGPQSHLKKQGTPTMGGLMFFAILPVAMIISLQFNKESLFMLFCAMIFGCVGLLDDSLKIIWHRSLGLRAWQKIALQIFATILVLFFAAKGLGLNEVFWIPGTRWVITSPYFYILIMFIVISGTTNAANLTDGLDGLLASVTFIIAVGYLLIAKYEQFTAGIVFAAIIMGSMLAFIVYNRHPARVFMGDTGSFFIGGAIVGLAILTKTEFLLPLICLIYVMEAASVIIQVIYFKTTGKRFFRMAPLHHHFELSGLKENQVVVVFLLITSVAVLLSLMAVYNVDVVFLQRLRG